MIRESLIELLFCMMLYGQQMIPGCLSSLVISLVPFQAKVRHKDPSIKWTYPEPFPDVHERILSLLDRVTHSNRTTTSNRMKFRFIY